MAKEYLNKLSVFVKEVTAGCFADVKFECKHFFSGAALYVNDRICMSLTPVGLAMKLPEETKNCLLQNKTAVPLRYFPQAAIKKDYVLFASGIRAGSGKNSGKALHGYAKESIEYVLTLSKQE